MTTSIDHSMAAWALTDAELSEVAGGMIPTVAITAVARFLKSINFEAHGCTTSENGLTACSYSYDTLPGEM